MLARLLEEESGLDGNTTLHERAIALAREALRRDPENDEARAMLAGLSAP
jgi:cytochrome c-type biogenesis protein CcmH/NrfG